MAELSAWLGNREKKNLPDALILSAKVKAS